MAPPAWHHVAVLGLILALAGLGGEARAQGATNRKFGEMVFVPAGEFWMGSEDAGLDETNQHPVYLDAYHLDKYEVTNAEYRRFVNVTGRAAPSEWSDPRFNGPTQPVVGVTWHDAEAYCRWAGKRLPTEAEWEKAARGRHRRRYPWGNRWDASRANSYESKLDKPVPVGSYPTGVSPYGAHDMAGNVWEWVADWHDHLYYRNGQDRNPRGPDTGTDRSLRGGAWDSNLDDLRAAKRSYAPPDRLFVNVGIRCARGSP